MSRFKNGAAYIKNKQTILMTATRSADKAFDSDSSDQSSLTPLIPQGEQ